MIAIATTITGTSGTSHAQLISGWSAPAFDDGNPVSDPVAAWQTDVTTGDFIDLPELGSVKALAVDNVRGRVYATTGRSLATFGVNAEGAFSQLRGSVRIQDAGGTGAESGQVAAMGFARDVIYASVGRKRGDERRNRGIPAGLYAIDPTTAVATLIRPSSEFPLFEGFDYNPDDGRMYAITGAANAQSIVTFDLDTFTVTSVADVPASAYGGTARFRLDGVAVGEGKVYLTSGSDELRIAVYDIASGAFGQSLLNPPRFGENTTYPGGATFVASQRSPAPICGDGICNGGENVCSCAFDCGVAPAETCDNGVDDDCDGYFDCDDADCASAAVCNEPPPPPRLSCNDLVRFDSARCIANRIMFVVSTRVAGDIDVEVNGARSAFSLRAGTNVLSVPPSSSGAATITLTAPSDCFQPLVATCR